MNVVSIIISALALIASVIIGIRQISIDKKQSDLATKIELYISVAPVRVFDGNEKEPKEILPAMSIINISAGVVYLEKYLFNGREYPLNEEVLPPASYTNALHYIYLPTDGSDHVSFQVFFKDWQGKLWETTGYANLINREWRITYQPCKERNRKN